MPVSEALLLSVKNGQLEMTVEVTSPDTMDPSAFTAQIRSRLAEHAYQLMTDATLLDPPLTPASSCVLCRDPLPQPLIECLAQLGFEASGDPGGEHGLRSIFSKRAPGQRPGRRTRTRLNKWWVPYARLSDVSEALGDFEARLVDEGTTALDAETSAATIAAADSALQLDLTCDLDGLASLQETLLRARGSAPGRLILHPCATLGLAAFTGEAIRAMAPGTRWTDDEEAPLYVKMQDGLTVKTDPELRVVRLLTDGKNAQLTDYADAVIRQSLTGAKQA